MPSVTPSRSILRLYIPIVSTLVIYFLLLQFNNILLGVENHYFGHPFKYWGLYFPYLNINASIFPDIFIQIIISILLFSVSKKIYLFIIFQLGYMAAIYGGAALHISYFGGPPIATDIYSVGALFDIVDIRAKLLIALPFVVFGGIFLYNFRYSIVNVVVTVLLVASILILVFSYAAPINAWTKTVYPYEEWDDKFNYDARGAVIYSLGEISRLIAGSETPPSREDVLGIVLTMPPSKKPKILEGVKKRNVHLILVESLWDARRLKNAGLSDDPFDVRLRALWEQTGNSTAMSPVFGSGTANAEFEILCGQPVLSDGVVFQVGIHNDHLPCLPNILSKYGYSTIATHPNIAGFWNRVNAYRQLGFDVYRSKNDINMDDMNGGFLSNAALLKQDREYLSSLPKDRPVFDYVMTIAEHWKYSLNERRPEIIRTTSQDDFVKRYVNVIKYSTKELMDHVEKLRLSDPDAVIVMLGDHLPLFGANLLGYRESNLFNNDGGGFSPQETEIHASTPLIIIDGKNGPQKVGSVSMYEIPAMLMSYLGLVPPRALTAFLPDSGYQLRPLRRIGLLVKSQGMSLLCKAGEVSQQCAKYNRWMTKAEILGRDLRIGRQYLLKPLLDSGPGVNSMSSAAKVKSETY